MPNRSKTDYLNMLHSQAQSHWRTQKTKARHVKLTRPTINPFKIFLSVNFWGWIYNYLKSRVGKKHPFVDYTGASSDGVFKMVSHTAPSNDHIRIALAADWATDTTESRHVGQLMSKEDCDYTIHLGDIYFVGTPQEVSDNFICPGAPWPRGRSGSLAVPGNHEYYSNGNPFFNQLLQHLFAHRPEGGDYHQQASFFCLENRHWRLIALDNGYYSVGPLLIEYIFSPDAHLDEKLIGWLRNVIKPKTNDPRGIVILSHIQYCSAFEGQYPKAAEVLDTIFPGKEVIWIWGHEHRFAVYNRYKSEKGIAAYGRCIGHGGMPVEIGKVRRGKEKYTLPNPKKLRNAPLVCYDNRKKEIVEKTILGYNGYAILTLDHNRLIIEYKDTSTWLFREEFTVDANGGLTSQSGSNPNVPLS
jgi:hypothetical protein